jgi:hypothetical protein
MNPVSFVISFLVVTAIVTPSQEPAMTQHDILVYLPVSGSVEGWNRVGSPRVFKGEGLYDLIDGGAVIYYEYGFKQTVTQEYENIGGQSVDLQIYEMADPASAYGVYTFLKGTEGDEVDIGSEGIVADYYVYYWKSNFLVTLIASNSDENTVEGMLSIAKAVNNEIVGAGQRPSLCNLLALEGQEPSHIYYLEGVLALSNIYQFAADDIFALREGVVGNFGDFKLFIFKYSDAKESSRQYATARNALKNEQRFVSFKTHDNECSMFDEQGLVIHVKSHRSFIFVYLGNPDIDPRAVFYKIENNLR